MSLGNAVGFWGEITSSVDWCEINYEHSFYIAEIFNTISSLAMLVIGEYGAWMNHTNNWKQRFCFHMISIIGIGSFLFHMTLKYYSQMLDELPMVWTSALVLDVSLNSHFKNLPGWVSLAILAVTVYSSFVTAFYSGPLQADLFRLMFCSIALASISLGIYSLYNLPRGSLLRKMTANGFTLLVLGVISWKIDLDACDYLSKLPFNPQLHAIWHVLISLGTYQLILLSVYSHQATLSPIPPVLKFVWGMPYLVKGSVPYTPKYDGLNGF